MPTSFSATLDAFERCLAEPRWRYEPLISAFREGQIPAEPSSADLERLYAICYRLIGLATPSPSALAGLAPWQLQHLQACARDWIETTLYDRNANIRASIEKRTARFIERGKPLPAAFQRSDLPPRLTLPWSVEEAAARIRPFLDHHEGALQAYPLCHITLAWHVAIEGYPVFRAVIGAWLDELDTRRLGLPGTREALSTALSLHQGNDTFGHWPDCASGLMPLLDAAHPLLAAGAARRLGELYAEDAFAGVSAAPPLATLLHALLANPHNIAIRCGGFVCGYDDSCMGLSALSGIKEPDGTAFDLDAWVLDIYRVGPDEPYLPNAQSLWFYVHEHYCADPAFITRLIDLGEAWVALMCATELNEPVEGMEAVLTRLARPADETIAVPARHHLARVYGAKGP